MGYEVARAPESEPCDALPLGRGRPPATLQSHRQEAWSLSIIGGDWNGLSLWLGRAWAAAALISAHLDIKFKRSLDIKVKKRLDIKVKRPRYQSQKTSQYQIQKTISRPGSSSAAQPYGFSLGQKWLGGSEGYLMSFYWCLTKISIEITTGIITIINNTIIVIVIITNIILHTGLLESLLLLLSSYSSVLHAIISISSSLFLLSISQLLLLKILISLKYHKMCFISKVLWKTQSFQSHGV